MSVISGPAAAHMDAIYRHQRYFYDATRRYYLLGRDQMIANLNPPPRGAVLEVACGTARNLLCAARRYPNVQFLGFDISEEMLKTARRTVALSPYSGAITLAAADATAFDARALFSSPAPDRIFISYALSMIPAWHAVVDRALDQLAPAGELHIVDFGRMASMPALARRAMYAWLAHFSVTPRSDLKTVVHDAATRHGLPYSFREGRAGYAAHAIIGRPHR